MNFMKKNLAMLLFTLSFMILFSCKNSASINKEIDEPIPTPPVEPVEPDVQTGKIHITSDSPYNIRIYSDLQRSKLVTEISSHSDATINTTQIPSALYYYDFAVLIDSESNIYIPYHDDDCVFSLATSVSKVAEQKIVFPKNIQTTSCYIVLKNKDYKAIKFMKGDSPISNTNIEGLINPNETAVYEIRKPDFSNLSSYKISDVFGKKSLALSSIIQNFEAGKIYKISYSEDSTTDYDEIKPGIIDYVVEHKKETVSGEYEVVETENLYGMSNTMTFAIAKEYVGFTSQEFSQQEIKSDSIVVEIYYTRNTVSVTFDANGGTFGNGDVEIIIAGKYEVSISMPENPQRENYIFIGWNESVPEKFGIENKTFTAVWEAVRYTITYNLNGGTNPSNNPDFYTVESGKIVFAEPTKEDFSFVGWYEDESFTQNVSQIDSTYPKNITLWAKWTRTTFEATASTISSVVSNCKSTRYVYTIKIKGSISESDLKTLQKALKSNSNVMFNIELLKCTGLTRLAGQYSSMDSTEYAIFSNLNNLLSIKLGGSISSLGNNVFNNCQNLKEIVLLGNFTSIGNLDVGSRYDYGYANSGVIIDCPKVASLRIPATVEHIVVNALNLGNSIKEFEIDANNYEYSVSDDKTLILNKDKTVLITAGGGVSNVVVPKGVKRIAYAAFHSSDVKSIMFNDDLEEIENMAFMYTQNLSSITIPDSVKKIGITVFFGSGIENVIIGSGIEYIGRNAFNYWGSGTYAKLGSIVIKALVPPISDNSDNAIYAEGAGSARVKVFVPAESVYLYKEAPAFANRKDYIYPITE